MKTEGAFRAPSLDYTELKPLYRTNRAEPEELLPAMVSRTPLLQNVLPLIIVSYTKWLQCKDVEERI